MQSGLECSRCRGPEVRWLRGNIRTISGTGACLLTASRATDSYYSAVTLTQSTTATKATPVVTWKPASIQLGCALDSAQLDATSTVADTFAHTPPSGTQVTTNSLTLTVPNHSWRYSDRVAQIVGRLFYRIIH